MKKTLFNIDETEKQRILEMHISEIKKQLGEQAAPAQTTPTPKVETTQFTPQNFETVGLINGVKSEILKDGKPLTFTITPTKSKMKDQKGNIVPVPGVLSLQITPEGLNKTRAYLDIDCKNKKIKKIYSKWVEDDYSKVTLTYQGREYTGVESPNQPNSKHLMSQIIDGGKGRWTYSGPIKQMADKYCQSV